MITFQRATFNPALLNFDPRTRIISIARRSPDSDWIDAVALQKAQLLYYYIKRVCLKNISIYIFFIFNDTCIFENSTFLTCCQKPSDQTSRAILLIHSAVSGNALAYISE